MLWIIEYSEWLNSLQGMLFLVFVLFRRLPAVYLAESASSVCERMQRPSSFSVMSGVGWHAFVIAKFAMASSCFRLTWEDMPPRKNLRNSRYHHLSVSFQCCQENAGYPCQLPSLSLTPPSVFNRVTLVLHLLPNGTLWYHGRIFWIAGSHSCDSWGFWDSEFWNVKLREWGLSYACHLGELCLLSRWPLPLFIHSFIHWYRTFI